MRVADVLYTALASDEELVAMLAHSVFGTPAIYDGHAHDDSPLPYLVYRWQHYIGNHFGKYASALTIDVWTDGASSIDAENIRNRIIEILDRQRFEADEAGQVRVYLSNDILLPEDSPTITHWSVEFDVVHWRRAFIGQLNEGG